MKFIIQFSIGVFSLFILNTVHATTPPFYHTTLANGLNVVIKEDHRAPLVMVQVWYNVGGADEPKDKMGISHVLEHMMFKGTVRVPGDELKRLNAVYGGSLNAVTNANSTYYYQLYPKEFLSLALELEADRMSNLSLQYQNFRTEIQVVKEERRQRIDDNPQALAFEAFRQLAYPNSAYQQPVIGYMHNLNNINLSDLQDWYDAWYAPNNATIVIVGDITTQQTLLEIQRFFGDIPKKVLENRAALTQPSHLGKRHLLLEHPTQVANLYMAWNVPSLSTGQNTIDIYTLNLLKNLLGGQISSRINQQLIKKEQKLIAVNVSYDMVQRGDTLFTITAIPNPTVPLAAAQHAIESILNELQQTPIDITELERIQTMTAADFIYQQDTLHGQAQLLGALASNGLPAQLNHQFIENTKKITPFDLQHITQKYFSTNNQTTLYLQAPLSPNISSNTDMPETNNQTPPTTLNNESKQEQ